MFHCFSTCCTLFVDRSDLDPEVADKAEGSCSAQRPTEASTTLHGPNKEQNPNDSVKKEKLFVRICSSFAAMLPMPLPDQDAKRYQHARGKFCHLGPGVWECFARNLCVIVLPDFASIQLRRGPKVSEKSQLFLPKSKETQTSLLAMRSKQGVPWWKFQDLLRQLKLQRQRPLDF